MQDLCMHTSLLDQPQPQGVVYENNHFEIQNGNGYVANGTKIVVWV